MLKRFLQRKIQDAKDREALSPVERLQGKCQLTSLMSPWLLRRAQTGGISGEIKEEIGRVDNNSDQLTKKQRRKKLRNYANQTFSSPSGEDHPEKIVAVANTAVSVELENLDEQVNTMIDLTARVLTLTQTGNS